MQTESIETRDSGAPATAWTGARSAPATVRASHAAHVASYRPDVDGLRAIAILSVVVYHAHQSFLPGGFVGVDVFFVISGYLITRLIAKEIRERRFSIARFYVRRTKRILPAMFVALFGTALLGLFLLTPTELASLGKSIAATAAFVSNLAFWQETGYFDVAAERKLLLHTWSLAVEEQFYLLWPVTLWLILRFRLNLRRTIGLLAAVSFAFSCYALTRHAPSAFFLLPSRGWELLMGAALALSVVPAPVATAHRHVVALAGLVALGAGIALVGPGSPFPGWNAVLPCLGTALLIAAGERGDNVVARYLLTQRPMVFVGLISYSLYLWHWPLLSVARITQRGELPVPVALVIAAAAFGLSVLTWRYVEVPLRATQRTPAAAPVLVRYALLSLLTVAVGVTIQASGGFIRYARPEIALTERARYDGNPLSGECLRWQAQVGPLPGDRCISEGDRFGKRVVLWGDSHADAVAPGVVEYARAHGFATYQLTMAGCPPLLGAELEGRGASYAPCAEFNRQVIEYIRQDARVSAVMLVSRWPLYTENARFGQDDPGPISYLVDEQDRSLSSENSKRVFARTLDATVQAIHDSGKAAILLGTIPPLGLNVPECLARNNMPLSGVRDCSPPADLVLPHLAFADQQIQRVAARRPGVCGFLPKETLCAGSRCASAADEVILYANDDHLSAPGALFLARHFDFDACLQRGSP